MKKLLLTFSLVTAASVTFGQGTITFDTLVGTQVTNTTSSTFQFGGLGFFGPGVSGPTAATANGFYYTLLIAPTSKGSNPAAPGWTQAVYNGSGIIGTNFSSIAGDALGPKGNQTTVIDNWSSGATMSFMIVGWSANLGTTWAPVLNEYNQSFFAPTATYTPTNPGFFGVSSIGSGASGIPPTGLALNVWATTGTFSMFQVTPSPEPATMVLAGLGGLSLLALRRRK